MERKIKIIKLTFICAAVFFVVYSLYPASSKLLVKYRSYTSPFGYKMYQYEKPDDLVVNDNLSSTSAISVPILMYHGVLVHKSIGPNTDRSNFIEQMEMLKKEGYTTITVKEFDDFRNGKFKLPAKPIIITFDDGRRDSYYTVDEVLKALGFKATIFLATIKADSNDPFYLDWDELKKMKESGRWEIQAHGKNSHEKIVIDSIGTTGRFYTSRKYSKGGLESIADYEKRIEEDYKLGIKDIEDNLNIIPEYFAVPLSDYGLHEPTNFTDSYLYNKELTKKYFKMSFSQAADYESFYNYKDVKPHEALRFEVKDISSKDLLSKLNKFSDKKISFNFPNKDSRLVEDYVHVLYGDMILDKEIILRNNSEAHSARLTIGSVGWQNYSFDLVLVAKQGKSASVLVYYKDEENFISINQDGRHYWLSERVDGVETELTSIDFAGAMNQTTIHAEVRNNSITVNINGQVLANNVIIQQSRGSVGLTVWDPTAKAEASISKLILKSTK